VNPDFSDCENGGHNSLIPTKLEFIAVKVIQGHRPWCQSKAHICNFLVISSN